VQAAEQDPRLMQIWEKIFPTLENLLALELASEQLPSWSWWGKDKSDNQREINELLNTAVATLSADETSKTRDNIKLLEGKIRSFKNNIADYRQAQITAPRHSHWRTTVTDYEEKIQQLQQQISQTEQMILQLKNQFAQQLSQLGLNISQTQLDSLLTSVVGDSLIQGQTVYQHVKQIHRQLMTLAKNSGEDLEISKRYYGLHTILLKILLHMQETFLTHLDAQYLPKLEKIIQTVQDMIATTQGLFQQEVEETRRQHLRANFNAQELTLKTARSYKLHLTAYRNQMVTAKDKTAHDLAIAQNTYKTVAVSGELIHLLHTSQQAFDSLLNLSIPELLKFENLQMQQEFAILTQKLVE
jgi:hypothetical protein